MAHCLGLHAWAGTRRNIHPLTPILIIRRPSSTSSIFCDSQRPPYSRYMFVSPFLQPIYRTSLVFLLVWDPLFQPIRILASTAASAPPSTLSMSHTHTHPFNGPLSRTAQVSRYQKGKPIWILLKQETVSGSGIRCATCKFAPCSS